MSYDEHTPGKLLRVSIKFRQIQNLLCPVLVSICISITVGKQIQSVCWSPVMCTLFASVYQGNVCPSSVPARYDSRKMCYFQFILGRYWHLGAKVLLSTTLTSG